MQQPYPGQQQIQYQEMNPQQVLASSSQYEILDEEIDTVKEKKAKTKETPVEVVEPTAPHDDSDWKIVPEIGIDDKQIQPPPAQELVITTNEQVQVKQ